MNNKFVQTIINHRWLGLITLAVIVATIFLVWQFLPLTKKVSLTVRVPENYTEKIVFSLADHTFGISPIAAAEVKGKKKLFASEYNYFSAYEKINVRRQILDNGLKEEIILLEPGHPMKFSFQLDWGDFDYQKDLEGNITLLEKIPADQENNLRQRLYLPAPYFIDATGAQSDTSQIEVMLEEDGKMTYILNQAWLDTAQYPVILDPSVELIILNVHSYPQTGDDWIVDFTTQGVADLRIVPADQATIDDDVFVALYCNGEERIPQILPGDIIYFPDWECLPRQGGAEAGDGVGRVVHYTEYAGKHTLRFEFGEAIGFAYNSDWWNPSWAKRKKIFFDTTTSATTSNLTDFPLAVQLNSTRVDYAATQNSGQDVRFTDIDGTELPYEIEKWNESGTSTLWVKVPQIDQKTTADYIWLYYGNSTATDNSTTTGVWTNGYIGVWHMNNAPTATTTDSTVNSLDGIPDTLSATTTVKLGGALQFGGSGSETLVANTAVLNPADAITMEGWVNPNHVMQIDEYLMYKYSAYFTDLMRSWSNAYYPHMYVWFSGSTRSFQSSRSLATSTWDYVVSTYDKSDGILKLYMDGDITGTAATTTGATIDSSTNGFAIGKNFDGVLDEIRLSSVARSINWIKFSYCNMDDTCLTYGTEETDTWWNTNWKRRKKIMFNTTTSATTTSLVDFPVAVQLNSARVDYAYTKTNGEDIRFVDSNGTTTLLYEIEKWDKSATSTFWVKVPEIDRNSNSDHIWLYYGNPAATDNSTTTGVWTNNYIGVWHMNNANTASTTDSTSNALHGSSLSLQATTTAKLGSALGFNGTSSQVNLGTSSILNPANAVQVEAWAYPTTVTTTERFIFARDTSYFQDASRSFSTSPHFYVRLSTDNWISVSSIALTAGTWQYLTSNYDSGTGKLNLYLNKVLRGSYTTTTGITIKQNSNNTYIGEDEYDSGENFYGALDEVRLSSVARSLDWIEFSYCNMNDTCSTYGKEQIYGWWDARWQKRKPIYFDTTTSATTTDLANFTAVVRLNSSRINYTSTQNNGEDIRFVDADGVTVLPYEIEKWNESGESIVWVKVPKIDKDSTTDHIWMYYDNLTATDNSSTTATWDSNFVLVHHMQETDLDGGEADIKDSSLYQNHGTTTNMTTADQVSGKVDGSFSFGTSSYVNVISKDELKLVSAGTVEAWVKFDEFIDEKGIVNKATGVQWVSVDYGLVYRGAGFPQKVLGTIVDPTGTTYNALATDALTTGTWYRIVFTWDGSKLRIYRNGKQVNEGNQTITVRSSDLPVRIGTWGSTARSFPGDIDEIRVSNVTRHPQWIDFSYCNMNDSCVSFGAEEAQAIKIYRSMGFNNTQPLASGSSTLAFSISGFTATFTAPLPLNIGVGDAIQYDSDSNSSVDSIVFIHKRISSTQYEIRTANGTSTPASVASDYDWRIYRAYTSLTNAETGTENSGIASAVSNFDAWTGGNNLVASNWQWNIILYADAVETAGVSINGWTTTEKNYIRVYVPYLTSEVGISQRHSGSWDSTKYNMQLGDVAGLITYDPNVIIEGLQIWNTTGNITGNRFAIWVRLSTGPVNVKIYNNILRGSTNTSVDWLQAYTDYISSSSLGGSVKIWNNMVYDYSGTNGVGIETVNLLHYLYNNTIINCDQGVYERGIDPIVKNIVSYGNTNNYYGTYNSLSTNNLSGPSQTDAPGSNPQNAKTVNFRDYDNDDFRLASTDSSARDKGIDLSGDGNPSFNYDIENQTRQGPWDIGADEYNSTELGAQAWWQSAWSRRVKIRIDNSSQSENLVDFPLVVSLYGSRIDYANTKDSGEDIRFVDADGTTVLPYEIEKWDESATSTVWVKVPQINGGSNSDYIWMYYGNLNASDNSTTTGVWNSNYKLVYHLSETSGNHLDSTEYANNATVTTVTNQGIAAGIADGTSYFNGTNNQIDIPDNGTLDLGPLTLDFWVNPDSFPRTYNNIITKYTSPSANYAVSADDSGHFCVYSTGNNCSTYIFPTSTWTHVVAVMTSSTNTNLYINGTYRESIADGYDPVNDSTITIGNDYGYDEYFTGYIDEVRISDTDRGANWYAFEYCNISNNCLDYQTAEIYGEGGFSGGSTKIKSNIKVKGGVKFK